MLSRLATDFWQFMHRGGPVMWPLLVMSIAAVTMILERMLFWTRLRRATQPDRVDRIAGLLREGNNDEARRMVSGDASVLGSAVAHLIDHGPGDESASEVIERQRPRIERFMPTLSTIITAAPMLGILGTVAGIIASFEVLSAAASATDPRLVGQGIAEALLTTAAGLVLAIVVLFPYNAFRVQIDRALSRLEALASAARTGQRPQAPPPATPASGSEYPSPQDT